MNLSEHEQLIVILLSQDMTPVEIAEELKMSRSAVNTAVFRIREKIGCKTTHGMVAKAISKRVKVTSLLCCALAFLAIGDVDMRRGPRRRDELTASTLQQSV